MTINVQYVKMLTSETMTDYVTKKLNKLEGKFDFIISSIAKNCGHDNFKENYKCSFYKPLISSTLIN